MSWHYSNDGKQNGPISDTEFEASVRSGTIHANTLVWKEGFPQWKKFSEVGQSGPGGDLALATATRCAECGREFAQDEMVAFSGTWVCAECKPQYVQKIKEGVRVNGDLPFAGFGIRFGAKFLDGILLQIIGYALGAMAGIIGASGGPRQLQIATACASILSFAVQIGYNVFFVGKYGGTLGKMAVKIKIIRSNGEPVSYARAVGRAFAEMLSGILLGIGYLMVAWDPERRSLHDRICDTRVIKR